MALFWNQLFISHIRNIPIFGFRSIQKCQNRYPIPSISRPYMYRVPTGRLYMVLLALLSEKTCIPSYALFTQPKESIMHFWPQKVHFYSIWIHREQCQKLFESGYGSFSDRKCYFSTFWGVLRNEIYPYSASDPKSPKSAIFEIPSL